MNLVMSILYIGMFVRRRGPRAQSIVIAVAKWIGTAAPTVLFGFVFRNSVVAALGIMTFILDVTYVALLRRGTAFFDTADLAAPDGRAAADGVPVLQQHDLDGS